jgi:hypothetical protein
VKAVNRQTKEFMRKFIMENIKTLEELFAYIRDNGDIVGLALELTGFEYVDKYDIDEMYTASQLIEDQSNIIDALRKAEGYEDGQIWATGSVYYHNYWEGGSLEEMEEEAWDWIVSDYDIDTIKEKYSELF